MLRSKIIIFAAAILSLTSCNEWLQATSSTRIPADKLYETRGGFCDALSGIYISLGNTHTYAGSMTFYYNDLVAYPFSYSSSTATKAAQSHEYSNSTVKSYNLSTWLNMYKSISNINLELEMLEAHRDVINDPNEYRLFKGELTALRAYLHLDLMRRYGLGNITGDNVSKLTIPYVTTFDKEPTAQLSYEQTCKLIAADIDTAIVNLQISDPCAGNITAEDIQTMNQDGYWTNRNKHMNYWAAVALMARFLQWTGDTQGAAFCAQQAIDGALANNLVTWADPEAIVNASQSLADNTFSTEHLFTLEVANLNTLAAKLVSSTYAGVGDYMIPTTFIDDVLYQRLDSQTGSLAGAEDIRGPLCLLSYSATGYSNCKFLSNSGSPSYDLMPMIRLSEMYYIVAENQIAQQDNAGALATLDEVRRHRGISDTFPDTAVAEDELMKEYYREFIGEGQLIYWLKHKDVQESLSNTFTVSGKDLIFPYPDDEINYGRVQEL